MFANRSRYDCIRIGVLPNITMGDVIRNCVLLKISIDDKVFWLTKQNQNYGQVV